MTDESSFFEKEARSIFLGDMIGSGQSREVYVLHGDERVVVKIEQGARQFQNVEEWALWNWVRETPMARWFAPCVSISSAGSILIQKRVTPMRENERPKLLPSFLCDLKPENFGMYRGAIVCCDYGTALSSIRKTSKRMVKPKWRW